MTRIEDLRLHALDGVTHWSLAVTVQAQRIHSIEAEIASARQIPTRYTRTERLPFIHLRNDKVLLLFAAANLLRAHSYLSDLASPNAVPSPPGTVEERTRLLRDCAEHWDERYPERSRSSRSGLAFRSFTAQFPGEDTDSHIWGPDGSTVGGLDVAELEEWAQAM